MHSPEILEEALASGLDPRRKRIHELCDLIDSSDAAPDAKYHALIELGHLSGTFIRMMQEAEL